MSNTGFNIADESRDREYFSIVPNYIINHSTLEERGFYLTLKRIAGEKGKMYYSGRKLAEQCGIGKDKVYKLIHSLVKRGWIRKSGYIPAKTKPRTVYSIVDLWQLNNEFYRKKKIVSPDRQSPASTEIVLENRQISSPISDTKEDQEKEELIQKEISKEKGLTTSENKYPTPASLREAEFEVIAQKYNVPLSFVRSKYDDLINYCDSRDKQYSNYFAALSNFVKREVLQLRKEAVNGNAKRGIDASRI